MSSGETVIRRLLHSDLAGALAIERRSFPTPWSLAMFVLELSRPSGICLAAAAGEELRGYLICARYEEAYHLMNIAVEPALRRHGLARALIEEMIAQAGEDANYTLEVRVSNAPAIGLYESFGFRSVGTRRRYYSDTGEDAIIMWRAIGAPWES